MRHSLTRAPIIMTMKSKVEIFIATGSKFCAKYLFFLLTNIPRPTGIAVIKNIVSPKDKTLSGGASVPIKYIIDRIVMIGKVKIVKRLFMAV